MKFGDAPPIIDAFAFCVLQRPFNRSITKRQSQSRLHAFHAGKICFLSSAMMLSGQRVATLNDHGQQYSEIAESAAAAGHVSTPSIAIVSLARLSGDRSQSVIAVSPFASRVEFVRSLVPVRSCRSRRVSRNRLPIGTRLRTRAYLRVCVRRGKVHQRDRQSGHDTCAIRARARRSARCSVVARAVQKCWRNAEEQRRRYKKIGVAIAHIFIVALKILTDSRARRAIHR